MIRTLNTNYLGVDIGTQKLILKMLLQWINFKVFGPHQECWFCQILKKAHLACILLPTVELGWLSGAYIYKEQLPIWSFRKTVWHTFRILTVRKDCQRFTMSKCRNQRLNVLFGTRWSLDLKGILIQALKWSLIKK